jgi:hypothetical protein
LAKRSKSPISAHRPTAESVPDPAQATRPGDRLFPRRAGDQLGDRLLERVAADHDRVDRAEILQQRDLRAALAEVDLRQPAAVRDRPRAGGVFVADVVAQQQLAQPLPGAHQIAAQRLPGADDIAQRLLLSGRDPDRVQRVDHQQPQHALRVALIGLDLISGRPLDLPRRRDHTSHPGRL